MGNHIFIITPVGLASPPSFDNYTPENGTCPQKRDYFNGKYTSEPTIIFQQMC